MTARPFILVAVLLSTVAGCTKIDRNFGMAPVPMEAREDLVPLSPYRVEHVHVEVPRDLSVSERDSYFPRGDIVWREDRFGDRYEQVYEVVHTGLHLGADEFSGDFPIVVDVRVRRFHALSEKARYSVGGIYNILFDMQVSDAVSGEVLFPWYAVNAEFAANGGRAAMAEELQGYTQRVRIQDRLKYVMQYEILNLPDP
ncbi:MAG: hypothetical protein HUJ27_01480 [Rhodobacteraceae bacterium]|nr:hypothetical protein [Paracoccaceae bacterium]